MVAIDYSMDPNNKCVHGELIGARCRDCKIAALESELTALRKDVATVVESDREVENGS